MFKPFRIRVFGLFAAVLVSLAFSGAHLISVMANNWQDKEAATGECEMQIVKNLSKEQVVPGEEFEYKLEFKNIGNANCTGGGVHIVDHLDEKLEFVADYTSDNVTGGYNDLAVYEVSDKTLHWNADVLTPGEEGSVAIKVKTADADKFECGTTKIYNTAKVTALELDNFNKWIKSETVKVKIKKDCETPPPPVESVPPPPPPAVEPPPAVTPPPSSSGGGGSGGSSFTTLSLQKQVRNVSKNTEFADLINVGRGDILEYRIVVKNIGSSVAYNLVFTDKLSSSGFLTDFRSLAVSLPFTGSLAGQSSLRIQRLDSGQEAVITYLYTLDGTFTVGLEVCNTASVIGDYFSSISDKACVNSTQTSGINVFLGFSKKALNDTLNKDAALTPALKENYITYTLRVTNTGNSQATGFVIQDDLSGILSLADMVDLGGGILNGQVLTYGGVSIPAGGFVEKQFRVRVKAFLPNINYVMRNVYGNTVDININPTMPMQAPKTGSFASVFGAGTFGTILTASYIFWERRKKIAL